jgi:hypothetical protein
MSRVLRIGILFAVVVVLVVIPARANQVLERLSLFCGKAAALAHAHRGLPVAITTRQTAGPYTVSLWAAPDVGTGLLYVVIVPTDGVPFVAPRDVSIRLREVSGAGPERRYHGNPEPVAHGARFMAAVALPRVDTWRARVVIDGASGPAELQASFASVAPASPGLAGIMLYAAPFVLVAGLWGPARLVRRQAFATRPASIPSP